MSAAALPNLDSMDAAAMKALILSQHEQPSSHAAEIERFRLLITHLQRLQFGRKPERVKRQIEQLQLQLDDLEEGAAEKRERAESSLPPAAKGRYFLSNIRYCFRYERLAKLRFRLITSRRSRSDAYRVPMVRFFAFALLFSSCLAQTPGSLMTPRQFQALATLPADDRVAYGKEIDQFGELRVPSGPGPHPVVILIHGGCWRADFSNLHELGPIGDALKAKGVATWNVEYRRLGQPGGGWPGTYLDVGKGVDHLRSISATRKLDLKRVIVLGHSAGGHLALWAAARRHVPPSSAIYTADPLPLRGVIDLAGTADMAAFFPLQRSNCGGRAVVEELLGGTPAEAPQRYSEASPIKMLPLGMRQTLVWGKLDKIAPISLGEAYVVAAKRKNETVNFLSFNDIGHFEIATPMAPSWPVLEKEILRMLSENQ